MDQWAKVDSFPLYDARMEHDACGVGLIADLRARASHDVLREALFAVSNLVHRGAVDADRKTGDGAGVMLQLPQRMFLDEWARLVGKPALSTARVAVGVCFMPEVGTRAYPQSKAAFEEVLREQGFDGAFVWRHIPIQPQVLGRKARSTMPELEHLLLLTDAAESPQQTDRRLLVLRRALEARARQEHLTFYVASLSCRTIVYKGLMISPILRDFYPDLRDPRMETTFAVVHQRYSTNTQPAWSLAQPFRTLAHNGEINTIAGNRTWARVRMQAPGQSFLGLPAASLLDPEGTTYPSDSASLDEALEILSLGGRSLPHAAAMLVPEAWQARQATLDDETRAFWTYHQCLQEPWDGPAALVYADGDVVGASLDRNGLRPARYKITSDGWLVLGSEAGMLDLDEKRIVKRGRLGPGQMLVVDLVRGGVRFDDEIKHELSRSQPWAEWVSRHTRTIDPMLEHPATSDAGQRAIRQNVFGFSSEEFKFILEPMGEGKDPVGSMGDDTPLAPLSAQARLLPGYFKQRFAQVTNPPIDPIREKMVMSLDVVLGGSGAWLIDSPAHADRVLLKGPILTAPELAAVSAQLPCETLACCFDAHGGAGALERALDALCAAAVAAVARGARVLVLSDLEVSAAHAPIPILLAVGAVHHHLRREGKRYAVSLVAASGEPREVHHFAALIGYGASAIYPAGAYEAVTHDVGSADEAPARLERYRATLSLGLLKVMSKMGISALSSYHGAQLFEALGLSGEVLTRCFTGTPSRLGGGLTFDDIAAEALTRHGRAYGHERPETLDDHGQYRFRQQGELHAWSPQMLRAVKDFRTSKAPKDYAAYRDASVNRAPIGLRDLLAFKVSETPVPLEEVEPASDIVRRFTTAAMSLGSLSPETHETLAVAMNRLGGKSNTGEGGEDRRHYKNTDPEYDAVAAIKQVASGRFGVTVEYLMHAVELEIKMAQGSKPGEGGQIPGDKVTPLIARLRRSTPGVPLISPPPHHDIYSIEDLAQLIYDLRQVNPKARVCVKLVSSAGVGTIAAGVAKAGADTILISGHEGGTGASPWSSIKNAGSPWELGLAEAQQTLVLNGLRERVLLRADGGLRTGRDVMVAALLGAEEYNFGTAALVALGCRYVRQCHSNTCPVGIATQRLSLRKKYDGTAEQLEAFLTAVAEELRELLASMGYRSLDEVIGRSELLVPATAQSAPAKAARLDLSGLMRTREEDETRISNPSWHNPIMPSLNDKIMRDLGDALEQERPTRLRYSIRNTDRTIGARVSGKIARLYGLEGLPASTVELDLDGSAGQSFGAFLANGVRLTLRGEANDYVAKGMSGGVIAIAPRHEERRAGEILVGNTALYGATDGRVFIAGAAGERFAVRNSGATAVVEGVGAHGCEYMTGGAVMVLGETGDNFAAGMTGGAAYVWDPSGAIARRVAAGVVKLEPLTEERDVVFAHDLLHAHLQATNSPLARELMSRWEQTVTELWRLTPLALLDAVPMEDEDAPERVA